MQVLPSEDIVPYIMETKGYRRAAERAANYYAAKAKNGTLKVFYWDDMYCSFYDKFYYSRCGDELLVIHSYTME